MCGNTRLRYSHSNDHLCTLALAAQVGPITKYKEEKRKPNKMHQIRQNPKQAAPTLQTVYDNNTLVYSNNAYKRPSIQ